MEEEITKRTEFDTLIFIVCFLATAYPVISRILLHVDGMHRLPMFFYSILIIESIFIKHNREPLRLLSFEAKLLICWFIWLTLMTYFVYTRTTPGIPGIFTIEFSHIIFCILLFIRFQRFSFSKLIVCFYGILWGTLTVAVIMILFTSFTSKGLGANVYNTNEAAYLMLLGVFALYSIYYIRPKKHSKTFYITLTIFFSVFILFFVSRKAALALTCFIIINYFFIISKQLINLKKIMLLLLIIAIITIGGNYFLNNTMIGQKFQVGIEHQTEAKQLAYKFEGRGMFYVAGTIIFLQRPLGIGLHGYKVYAGGSEQAHSDYIVMLTETGWPGFILYFGMYLIILTKLIGSAFKTSDISRKKLIIYFILCETLILLLALGRWNYSNLPTYMFIALFGLAASQRKIRNCGEIN